jgi:hypothetical protein|nr:MAG TPA: hypothetical protein [Caudoviricetes sp.]
MDIIGKRKEIEILAYNKAMEKMDDLIKNFHLDNGNDDKALQRYFHIIRSNMEERAKNISDKDNGARFKSEFIYVEGVVIKVHNNKRNFTSWIYEVKIDESGINTIRCYCLYPGKFNKSNYPEVGDIVKLRSRKTKNRPKFSPFDAKIFEIVKRKGE